MEKDWRMVKRWKERQKGDELCGKREIKERNIR